MHADHIGLWFPVRLNRNFTGYESFRRIRRNAYWVMPIIGRRTIWTAMRKGRHIFLSPIFLLSQQTLSLSQKWGFLWRFIYREVLREKDGSNRTTDRSRSWVRPSKSPKGSEFFSAVFFFKEKKTHGNSARVTCSEYEIRLNNDRKLITCSRSTTWCGTLEIISTTHLCSSTRSVYCAKMYAIEKIRGSVNTVWWRHESTE